MDKQSQDWSNYWANRDGAQGEHALVGVESDPQIAAFWKHALSAFDKESRVLDLACGAGSVVRRAYDIGFSDLTGADISEAALSELSNAIPSVKTIACSADKVPFDDESFDLITSQYGFEYAGAEQVAPEIARLVSKGGQFIALVHINPGGIYEECAGKAAQMERLIQSGFFNAAKRVFRTIYAQDQKAYESAVRGLAAPRDQLSELSQQSVALAGHILAGTQQLFTRVANYTFQDVEGWLDGNQSEAEAFLGRMNSMMNAAQSGEQVEALLEQFSKLGLKTEKAEKLSVDREGQPQNIAWIIRAAKP